MAVAPSLILEDERGGALCCGSSPSANAESSRFLLARTRGEAGRRSLLHAILPCGRGTALDFGCEAYISCYTKTPHPAVIPFPIDRSVVTWEEFRSTSAAPAPDKSAPTG